MFSDMHDFGRDIISMYISTIFDRDQNWIVRADGSSGSKLVINSFKNSFDELGLAWIDMMVKIASRRKSIYSY